MSFSNVSTDNGLRLSAATVSNWTQLFHDSTFWSSLEFTAFFVFLAVTAELVFGLVLALLLWRRLPGAGLFRVLFTIPMMLGPVAVGFIFRLTFNEDYGPITSILHSLHLPVVPWLSSTSLVPFTIVIVDVWEWTPLMFLLLLAGLQALPEETLEAARVDGATGLRLLRHITLPILMPIAVTAYFLRMVLAFAEFGEIYLMTGGGPGVASTSTSIYGYFQGYQDFNLSYGSTISLALLVVVTVCSLLYLSLTRLLLRRVET
jgi:multiple sugar transport system permease protein